MVTLLNSTVYTYMMDSADYSFWSAIAACYKDGTHYRGSGVVGVLCTMCRDLLAYRASKNAVVKGEEDEQ